MATTSKRVMKRAEITAARTGTKSARELFGDNAPVTTTRQRLIETALELFYMYGFHAVGLDRVLADVGISKQAFYKHFESKDDLAVEAIKLRDQRESGAFDRQVRERSGDDPRKALLAMFDVLDEWFTHTDYLGCLFLSACAEFPSPHDPIHQAAAAHSKQAEAEIEKMAAAAGADDPRALARELMLLSEGAFTKRLVFGDNDAAKIARELAVLTLHRRLPKGGQ